MGNLTDVLDIKTHFQANPDVTGRQLKFIYTVPIVLLGQPIKAESRQST